MRRRILRTRYNDSDGVTSSVYTCFILVAYRPLTVSVMPLRPGHTDPMKTVAWRADTQMRRSVFWIYT